MKGWIAKSGNDNRVWRTRIGKSFLGLSLLTVLMVRVPVFAQSEGKGDTTPTNAVKKPVDDKVGIEFPFKEKRNTNQIKDFTPVQNETRSKEEYDSYLLLISHAKNFSVDQLNDAARKDVAYMDLVKQDSELLNYYRYDLIQLTGTLRSIQRFPVNDEFREAGIKELYEVWLLTKKGNPIVVIMHDLPPGIEPSLKIEPAVQVTVSGYYFKTIIYTTQQAAKEGSHKQLPAPLLMTRGIQVMGKDTDSSGFWSEFFIPAALTIGGLMAVVVLGGTLYYRMGDKKARKILKDRKDNPFSENGGLIEDLSNNPGQDSSTPPTSPHQAGGRYE